MRTTQPMMILPGVLTHRNKRLPASQTHAAYGERLLPVPQPRIGWWLRQTPFLALQNTISNPRTSLYERRTLTSVAQRKNLCRVSERDRTFAHRVESREEVDEEANKDNMSRRSGDERAQSCGQQRPSQMWESEEQQGPTTPWIDCVQSRYCKSGQRVSTVLYGAEDAADKKFTSPKPQLPHRAP